MAKQHRMSDPTLSPGACKHEYKDNDSESPTAAGETALMNENTRGVSYVPCRILRIQIRLCNVPSHCQEPHTETVRSMCLTSFALAAAPWVS